MRNLFGAWLSEQGVPLMSTREDRNQLLGPLESAAPNRKPLVLIGVGVVIAVVLLLGLYLLDLSTGASSSGPKKRLVDLDSITVPSNPTEEEIRSASRGVDPDSIAALSDGAWIQVADEEGRLAQEYSALRIDPLPDEWIDMDHPQALMYPSSGRVISMTATSGKAHVPSRAMESGELKGNVVIRIFEPLAGGSRVDILETKPSVVVHAETAEFDNVQGEITSEKIVQVTTDEITFKGEGLSIQLGEDGAKIERLIVDRAVEPIKIRRRIERAQEQLDPPAVQAPVTNTSSAVAQASTSEPKPKPKPSVAKKSDPVVTQPDAPTWYRLVLHDDIVIERFGSDGSEPSTVRGDELVATFALGEGGIEAPLAQREEPQVQMACSGAVSPMNSSTFIASAVAAGLPLQDAPKNEDGIVLVHFSGRLVMIPDPDAATRMSSRNDAEIVVKGLDGRGITVRDESNDADVTCAQLIYQANSDTVRLIGDELHPLDLVSPRMRLAGGSFWLKRSNGTGGLVGAGRMLLAQGSASLEAALKAFPHALTHALADARSESRAMKVAAVRVVFQDSEEKSPKGEQPNLEITWQEGIDLDFDDLDDAGRIKQARFRGDVNVLSQDFNLTSETLAVDFTEDAEQEDAVERIVAGGGARVQRVGESGSLAAETIDLSLTETEDGRTVPTVMTATGGVEAIDPSQQMWSENLVVHFKPAPEPTEGEPQPENQPQRGFAGGMSNEQMGSVQITTVNAKNSVQVRMKDGARIFAEKLDGDAVNRNLNLAGENVMLLRENVIADQMREVKLDDAQKTVRGMGPGRFRYFEQPIVPETTERIDRPAPNDQPSLAATWTESLEFLESENNGGGRLDLAGKVRVRSEADPKETGRLDAETLRLDLSERKGDAKSLASPDTDETSGRDLEKITAKGDAIMESRTWETAARNGDPRLFRVTGNHVEYEPITREALVKGKGRLLVHDPQPQKVQDEPSNAPIGVFGVDGTSRFKWAKGMTMRREIDDRYLITMEEDVEVLHAGLKEDDTFSLTGDRLEITVDRSREEGDAKKAPNTDEAKSIAQNGVDLGGPAEMLRVRGIGKVFVRTPEQDVDCEEFDYNVETQIAMLRARPGRVVTIQPKNSATPIRAELLQWDLRTGRIRIMSGEGGISR